MGAMQDLLPSARLANLSPCSHGTFIARALGQFLDLHAWTSASSGHELPHIKHLTVGGDFRV